MQMLGPKLSQNHFDTGNFLKRARITTARKLGRNPLDRIPLQKDECYL